MLRVLPYILLAIIFLALALRLAVPYLSSQPDNLGVSGGKLADCPNSPNCVSSFATDELHRIEPISFDVSTEEIRAKLLATLESLPRIEIVAEEPTYIHAITRSRLMGYMDDNEFLIDESSGLIHVRAAARLGQSDLGANRARFEDIRDKLTQ